MDCLLDVASALFMARSKYLPLSRDRTASASLLFRADHAEAGLRSMRTAARFQICASQPSNAAARDRCRAPIATLVAISRDDCEEVPACGVRICNQLVRKASLGGEAFNQEERNA